MINGVLTCVAAPPMRGDARDGGQQTHAQRMQDEYSRYDFEISRRFLDGRKTRRTDPQGREQGVWETEEDDDEKERGDD